jgi:hypothetical protein
MALSPALRVKECAPKVRSEARFSKIFASVEATFHGQGGRVNRTVAGGDGIGREDDHETVDWSGWIGKIILVASPFLLLVAFLILEVWIRGRF